METDIPSMGGAEISPFLYETATDLNGIGSVVECGSWLGASIAPVAQGLADSNSQAEIHCFDQWEASNSEVKKAKKYGVNIKKGQNLLPLFLKNVRGIYPKIITHKNDLLEVEWSNGPIELYIDDANKSPRLFNHAMKAFGPNFVPGETIIVFMDYQYYDKNDSILNRKRLRCQPDFVESNKRSFKKIADFDKTSGVAFKYRSSINWDKPILKTPFQRLYARSRIVRKVSNKCSSLV